MQTRGAFLTSSAALALIPAAGGAAPSASPSEVPSPASSPSAKLPPGFSLAGFDAVLTTAAAHRHLVACTQDAGRALETMRSTLNAYVDIGVDVSDVHLTGVFYHQSAVLNAFDDFAWNRYVIPATADAANPKEKAASGTSAAKSGGNPLWKNRGGTSDASIDSLVRSAGVRLFACNLATHGFASHFAKVLHLDAKTVYNDLAAHLVPNAMLVPAGVWAIHAIQERRYTILETSL